MDGVAEVGRRRRSAPATGPTSAPVLAARGLHHGFGDTEVLRGVDVSVRRSRGKDAGAACGQLALKRPNAARGEARFGAA